MISATTAKGCQARKQSRLYAPAVAEHLNEGRVQEAIALSRSLDYKRSHLAKVMLAGLLEYDAQTRQGPVDQAAVYESIHEASEKATSELQKYVSTLGVISSTAPFVALVGTAVGVINAFVGIGLAGSSGLGAVSASIAEAAIPAVWLYNYVTTRLETLNKEIDTSANEFVQYVARRAT
jgi:biopolymer transport protein ExbB/TolQ